MPFQMPPPGNRPRKPGKSAVDAQIAKLSRHELFQGEKRADLLNFLVRIQREGRYEHPFNEHKPAATGKRILFEFYKEWARDNGERDEWQTPDDSEERGKKLIGELAKALEEYYEKNKGDAVIVRIKRGRGEGYEPEITWRPESAPILSVGPLPMADGLEPVDCSCIGNNNAAVQYLTRRFRSSPDEEPKLIAFRDTHVRPERLIPDHVRYTGMQSAFGEFLRRTDAETTVATMILGWEIDKEYVRAMQSAAAGRGDQLKCFRLREAAPILNFILLDYSDLSTEVLFGWGQGKPGPPGAVFRSKDTRLVNEFNEFYEQLLLFSERVSLEALLEGAHGNNAGSAPPGLASGGR